MTEQEILFKRGSTAWHWSGLRARMTRSYIVVTFAVALIAETLLIGIVFVLLTRFTLAGSMQIAKAQADARWYALAAAAHADGTALNPHTSFLEGQAVSIALPPEASSKIAFNDPQNFALLIAPGGRVLTSTYPARYPVTTPVAQVLPHQYPLIANALAGKLAMPGTDATTQDHTAEVVETIWTKEKQPMGAIYVQVSLDLPGAVIFSSLTGGWVLSTLLFLVITIPLGAFFGTMTTRGLVRRIQRLVLATTQFAHGNDESRVSVMGQDEIGQLEGHFNRMAEQLVESSTQRQRLREENGRLAERARIAQELHDAISQNLFSLRMLAGGVQASLPVDSPLTPHMMAMQQTTTTVIREMRALLLELRPAQLKDQGLIEAIEDLAAAYRARLGITVTTALTPVSLSAEVEHALLRIAQESLANAARHADATAIILELFPQGKDIVFIITDNGAGFTLTTNSQKHGMGLRSMQERIENLHGRLTIETAPDQGTCIHLCLPQKQEKDHDPRCHR